MSEKRILVVDDNESIRALLNAGLKDQYIISCAENGEQALEQCYKFLPHLIILDIMLPDMSGYEICTQIKGDSALSDIPIIMLSAKTGVTARVTGYNLGAINYIEKPFELSELKAVINTALRIKNAPSASLLQACDITIDLNTQMVKLHEQMLSFTQAEYRLLIYMIKRKNEVLSRDTLLQISTPEKLEVTDRVIDNHISNIRKKLNDSQIKINSVYGEGYKLTL